MSFDLARIGGLPERLRERGPRIHCLVNTVAQKLVADGLSALGCVPSMTASEDEVVYFATRSDALLVNLGTLTPELRRAIRRAVDTGRPFVLDPVMTHISPLRHDFAAELIERRPFAIKANGAEIADLRPEANAATLVIETGETDRVSNGERTLAVRNGHPWLAAVSATGCLAGGIVAACATVEPDALHAGAGAMALIGIAAEMAAKRSRGPGTFAAKLLDALANLDDAKIRERLKVSDA